MASILNADDGVVSGSAGLKSTADSSGVLALQTNGTTAVTVTAAGSVGIGTTTPADALNISTGKKFRATHSASVYQQIFSSSSGNFLNAYGDNFQVSADSGAIYLTTVAAQPIVFQTTNTDRLVILSGGNVGIGTSSPISYATDARNLVIASSGNTGMTIKSGATSTGVISFANAENSTSNYGIVSFNHNDLSLNFNIYGTGRSYRFQSAGTEVMRLDSAGNLGLGVTPRQTSGQSIEFGGSVARTAINFNNSADAVGWVTANAYYDGTNFLRVFGSGTSSTAYSQNQSGSHRWYLGAAGTANTAISFTQAMTLDTSGQLLLGTTSNLATSRRELVMVGTNGAVVSLGNTTTADRFQIVSDSGENALLLNKANTPMIFYTNNTQRMRITEDGNLGIGTTSPTQKLDVNTTAGEVIAASSDRSTNGQYISGLMQSAKNSSSAYVNYAAVYGSITSNTAGSESGALTLWTRSGGTITERARFNSTGALVFAGGTTTANGIGITFPATQSASSDANTLDDYEEGTWTPTFFGTSVAGSPSYNARVAAYTKVGRLVSITCYLDMSNLGGMTGTIQIGGLPFTTMTGGSYYGGFAIAEFAGFTFSSGRTMLGLEPAHGQTTITIYNNGSGVAASQQTVANMADSTFIVFSGTYFSA